MIANARIRWSLLWSGALLPLQIIAAQNSVKVTPPKVTPQQQAEELRSATDDMYNTKLSAAAEAMRNDVILLRDSLDLVAAFAQRLSTAVSDGSPAVAASAAKSMRPACSAAYRTVATIRPRIKAVRLKAEAREGQGRADNILGEYRTALEEIDKILIGCGKELPEAPTASQKAEMDKWRATAIRTNKAITHYESTLRNTLNAFQIPLRPKQQMHRGF